MADFQITPAEVLEVLYGDSNPNLIYGIKVKPLDGTPSDDETTLSVMTAKPLNTSILRIPIKGEVVLILKAPSSYASGTKSTSDNYYFDIVSLQSSIHHNALPTISAKQVQTGQAAGNSDKYNETNSGNTKKQEDPKIDENFSENPTVKPLQPYVGDVIIEGRYGNSIRFTTTPKSGKFTVAPKWSGGPDSAPITIFRNSKQGIDTQKINDYITEDFTNNENIMVMASGQKIEFEQASKKLTSINSKNLTSWKDENWGTTPQTLISSGRLIFNSTQKEIIAFAKNGIGLSSETSIALDANNTIALNAPKIELGDGATEPIILGNQFQTWMNILINTIGTITVVTPVGPSTPLMASPQWAAVVGLLLQIPTLLSQTAFTKKLVTPGTSAKFKSTPVPDFTVSESKVEEKKAEQSALKEQHDDIEKTPDEKAAISDQYNRLETEIVVKQESSSVIESDAVSINDAKENSSEITQVVYSGEVTDGRLPTPKEDLFEIEPDETEDNSFQYAYISQTRNDTKEETLLLQSVTEKSKQKGLDAVAIALDDIAVREEPSGSLSGPRVDVYLQNIGCRPGQSPWGNGCIATWTKEAGLPIPSTEVSTANGWYEWAKSTNRWCASPIVGSIAVYGTKETSGKYQCHNMALVTQVIDSSRVLVIEGYINGGIAQSEVNVNNVLGFILPSETDIPKPVVNYDEGYDPEKGAGLSESPSKDASTSEKQKIWISNVVTATLSDGQGHGYCAWYTYNHAYNWTKAIKNKPLHKGHAFSAGGNANGAGYHKALVKLGYTKYDMGTMSKSKLKEYINNNNNFAIGDIICYWYLDNSFVSAGQYGHTQMYTGGHQKGATSKWTTDNTSNYSCSFVYPYTGSNTSNWSLIHLKAPQAE